MDAEAEYGLYVNRHYAMAIKTSESYRAILSSRKEELDQLLIRPWSDSDEEASRIVDDAKAAIESRSAMSHFNGRL